MYVCRVYTSIIFMIILKSISSTLFTKTMTSTWPSELPKWGQECLDLLRECSTNQVPKINLNGIIEKSKEFPIKFPINSMISQNLINSTGKETLERNIQSAYPIIHEHSLNLCARFLIFKRKFGTEREQKFYKNISLTNLVQRLLCKRAVSFMESCDSCLLLDKTKGIGTWDIIGTKREKSPFVLENCISYDEIKLSALLSVSSHTYFINDGNRFNGGLVEPNREYLEQDGVIVGLIGTRFERESKMEYEEVIISSSQNTVANGYGDSPTPSLHKVFAEFYDEPSIVYNPQISTNEERFVKLSPGIYFDNVVFKKRLALSFDTLLIEANHRSGLVNKKAYIHVVGIGLGVWKISAHETQLFMDTFGERIKFLGKNLADVYDVHFAYISGATNCLGYKHGDVIPIEGHPNGGIKIFISKREPHTTLKDEGKLLVVSYAWDGNALPGNEFWIGMLTSTGDSAAACSTQITELHNPHINPLICGENLHVALLDGTVSTVEELANRRSVQS